MKKILLSLAILFLIATNISLGLKNECCINLTLQAPKLKIVEVGNYTKIYIDRFDRIMIPGNPILPVKRYRILLPPNVDGKSLRLIVISDDYYYLNVSKPVEPAPPITSNSGGSGIIAKISKNNKLNEFYPKRSVVIFKVSQMRQYKFAELYFYPVQYDPLNGTLKIHRKIKIKILYNISTLAPSKFSRVVYDPVMRDVAKKLFVNWNEGSKWYFANIGTQSARYDYVIVTTSYVTQHSKKLNDFVNYLHSKGFNVKIVTEKDYGYEKGLKRAINIRNWLKEHYLDYGIKYVLLIGNPNSYNTSDPCSIPMMVCYPLGANSTGVPTDYFYADLTGNWDSNGDGFFGEYGQDNVDFAPEVYVGRIPIYNDNVTALDNILTKIMNYRYSGIDWRYRILIPVAISNYKYEDNYPIPKTDGRDLPKYVVESILPSNWSHFVLYEREGLDPVPSTAPYYSAPLTEKNVIKEWSKGYGAVFWWGHGDNQTVYRKVWVKDDGDNIPESGEIEWIPFFTSKDADLLNDSKPAFTFQCSCYSGNPLDPNNLGYSLLKHGAIATISSSSVGWYRIGYWYPTKGADITDIGYWFFVNLIKNKMNAGDALYLAKFSLYDWWGGYCWINKFDFNLYGDPSLSIYEVAVKRTIYVPDDYPKIQWAIDNASAGDVIIVRDGNYTENVVIDKPNITIKSENGSINCIVKAKDKNLPVFEVRANYVNVSGFTVKDGSYGVLLIDADRCNISNNIVLNNGWGIELNHSNGSAVVNNIVSSNDIGIYMESSDNNTLVNNTMSGNRYNFGVYGQSLSNFIQKIDRSNTVDGKPIYYLINQKDMVISSNAGFVGVVNSTNVTVKNLTLTGNVEGVLFAYTNNSRIENVTVSNDFIGLCLWKSSNDTITNNVVSNDKTGIQLINSSNNVIYLNDFVNDTCNVHTENSRNFWNSSKLTYTYNGKTFTSYLGNYWSDYTGNDSNGDGIGDIPYQIDSSNTDYHPLMQPFKEYVTSNSSAEIYIYKNEYLKTNDLKIDSSRLYKFGIEWSASVWNVKNLDGVNCTVTTDKNLTFESLLVLYENGSEKRYHTPPKVNGDNYTWNLDLRNEVGAVINFKLDNETVYDHPWVDFTVNETLTNGYTTLNVSLKPIEKIDGIQLEVEGDRIVNYTYSNDFFIKSNTNTTVKFENNHPTLNETYNFSIIVENPIKIKVWMDKSVNWITEFPSRCITLPVNELGKVTLKANVSVQWKHPKDLPQLSQSLEILLPFNVDIYDKNHDGRISIEELVDAFDDWMNNKITTDQFIEVFDAWMSS